MNPSMLRRSVVLVLSLIVACTLALAQEPPPSEPKPAPAPPPAAPAPAPAAPAATPAPPAGPLVDEVKIVVENKAKSSGEISFRFAPAGGSPKDVRVTVQSGMNKKDICRDIAKELTVALGDGFKVEQYDDDKVKVEGKNDAKFSLTIGAQTVTGLSVMLK